jgi:polyisoprenyl-teichoic acid--peptidoglycan teichoic acid transferase
MSSYLPTPKSKKNSQKPTPPPAPEPIPAPPPEPGEDVHESPKAPPPVVRRTGLPNWLRGSLAGLYIALLLVSGVLVFLFVRSLLLNNGQILNPFSPSTTVVNTTGTRVAATELPPLQLPAAKPWNGVDRVTILVMGLDARDVGDNCKAHPNPTEPARSDSMILLSMDPATKTAAILSIPRDLYVEVPGFGFDRINTAFFDAMANRLPGGGPALAMKTVENLVGVPIDYYAVIDFNAFASMVDEIGGIDVEIPFDNMLIAPCGLHNETLFQGKNHLNGPEALAYARDRHASATSKTGGSDFDRAARQQQVIFAIRDKVTQNWITLLPKASTLWNTLTAGVQTNLTFDQYFSLATIAIEVKKENIHTGVIGPNQLLEQTTITDEQVLIPNLDKIRALRNTIFDTKTAHGFNVAPPSDLETSASTEKLNIKILNGSGVTGLAASTKDYLVKHGFTDANISIDSTSWVAHSQITDFTGSLFTNSARYFIKLMNIPQENIVTKPNFDSPVDLQIVLGADWKVPQD